ncbi:helix-turn-helix domain-containing protein [Streptomyces sp. NPDC001970]
MSGLWSGHRFSLKVEDLDVICVVLGCEIGDLLIPEPEKVARLGEETVQRTAITASGPAVVPRRRDGRSLPPM